MLLSLILIIAALYWLMRETHYLTIRLAYGSIPVQCIEQHKHSPQIEPCRIINAPYPKPEPIKLLAEFCELTDTQIKLKRIMNADLNALMYGLPYKTPSYQQVIIGGHTLTLLAISPKLYDTIAEFQKIVDGKDRKPALKFAPINNFNPLCGKEWYNEHYQDVMPEQFIELKVNDKSISFDGDFKTGKIKEFIKANK